MEHLSKTHISLLNMFHFPTILCTSKSFTRSDSTVGKEDTRTSSGQKSHNNQPPSRRFARILICHHAYYIIGRILAGKIVTNPSEQALSPFCLFYLGNMNATRTS